MTGTSNGVMVGGIEVERRWATLRPIRRREGSADYRATIVLDDDGAPMVERFEIRADPPLAAGEVRPIDLTRLAADALRRKLTDLVGYDLAASEHDGAWEMSPADVATVDAQVLDALAQKRRRGTRVTDAFLIEVVKRYREHGISDVQDEYQVKERTARRWLADAKDRGLR